MQNDTAKASDSNEHGQGNREAVYETRIGPLLDTIAAACREHDIGVVAVFDVEDDRSGEWTPDPRGSLVYLPDGCAGLLTAMARLSDYPDERLAAKAAYGRYIASSGGKNYQGLPCPTWENLTEAIRMHWVAAVRG